MTRKGVELLQTLARLGAVLTLSVTVVGMLIPSSNLPGELPPDLLLHALGFGLPSLLVAFAARSVRIFWLELGMVAAAATIAEIAQAWVPGRTVSALDLAADAVGIAAGAWLGRMLQGLLFGRMAPRRQS